MKKQLLLLFLLSVIYPLSSFAQKDIEDVIYLKNGSIYRGNITEQRRDSIYKIEVYGGSSIVLSGNEIQKITKEQKLFVLNREALDSFKIAKRINKRKNLSIGLELALSYILYHVNAADNYGAASSTTSGAGLSLLPEIRKGKHFSVLTGASFNYILAKNYQQNTPDDESSTSIDKGYQIRFEIPLWLRWTYGNKLPFFFQFGWGIGGDFYKGWGSYGQAGGAYQYFSSSGWEVANTGFMNIIALGIGIRKKISNSVEIMSYLEIAPADIQFTGPIYAPYGQFHLGFNFNGKSKKDFRLTQ